MNLIYNKNLTNRFGQKQFRFNSYRSISNNYYTIYINYIIQNNIQDKYINLDFSFFKKVQFNSKSILLIMRKLGAALFLACAGAQENQLPFLLTLQLAACTFLIQIDTKSNYDYRFD